KGKRDTAQPSGVITYHEIYLKSPSPPSSAYFWIAASAATTRLPTVYGYREHVESGGLISYGVNLSDCFRRAATYVHEILKGAPVAALPVQFPTKLEFVINLKTAKALGLDLPSTVLVRADEVIE